MQRVFTKDVPRPKESAIKEPLAKKGDVRDWPMETWEGIVKSLFPKAKDLMAKLNEISSPVTDIGNLIPDKGHK